MRAGMASIWRLAALAALCLAGQALAWQPRFKGSVVAASLGSSRDLASDDFVSNQALMPRRLQQEGEGQGQEGQGQGDENKPSRLRGWKPRAHGYTTTIAMGLAAPLAIVVSRNFREFAPAWIWIHAPLSIAAFIGGIIGVIFGGQIQEDGLDDSVYSVHKALGGIALALFGINVGMGMVRPKPSHKFRRVFNPVHHWFGRFALVFAIINVYLGLHLSNEVHKFWWGYSIALGAIILLWLVKELVDYFAVLSSNRRSASSLKMAGPVNGSFASVFLLKDRPVPGQAACDGNRTPLSNGHTGGLGQQPLSHTDKTYGSPAIEMQQV